jgi:hypothetical protein
MAMNMEVSMKLDRYTARALVEANMMPLEQYIEMFGSAEEKDAGMADCLHVARPASALSGEREFEPKYGFPCPSPQPAIVRLYCH